MNVVFSGHDHIYERSRHRKAFLLRVRVRRTAAQRRPASIGMTAAGFDQDCSFMLVEVLDGTLVSSRQPYRHGRRRRRDSSAAAIAGRRSTHAIVFAESRNDVVKGQRRSFPSFIRNSMLMLPLGCIVALVWANTLPEKLLPLLTRSRIRCQRSRDRVFFAFMTKEVVEATLPGGDLHPWRRAALPIAAAIGGIIVPVIVYIGVLRLFTEPMLVQGWVVTCAVDVAACYLVGRTIFARHPAMPFLVLLALASNAIGLALLATIDPADTIFVVVGLTLVFLAVVVAMVMRQRASRHSGHI